ncbi:hypothetical protein [Acidisoma sp. C75]
MADHDDGLVHGHAWASASGEPPHHRRRTAARPPRVLPHPGAPGRVAARPEHPMNAFHEDGLAYDHSWAKTV